MLVRKPKLIATILTWYALLRPPLFLIMFTGTPQLAL